MINLKILFKNKTKYDKEIYRKFLEFHSKKYRFQSTLFNVIIIAFILFLIVLQIAYKYYSDMTCEVASFYNNKQPTYDGYYLMLKYGIPYQALVTNVDGYSNIPKQDFQKRISEIEEFLK